MGNNHLKTNFHKLLGIFTCRRRGAWILERRGYERCHQGETFKLQRRPAKRRYGSEAKEKLPLAEIWYNKYISLFPETAVPITCGGKGVRFAQEYWETADEVTWSDDNLFGAFRMFILN